MKKAIGMLEIRSIVRGIRAADSMAKAADVELLTADSICPGKFLAVIGGSVGAVDSALAVGEAAAEGEVVDRFFLANCHEAVFPAITGSVEPPQEPSALGLVETFSVASNQSCRCSCQSHPGAAIGSAPGKGHGRKGHAYPLR